MPLKQGTSSAILKENILELIRSKPSKPRAKGIKTLAKKRGISEKEAKQKQALAIAYAKKRQSK